MSETARTFLEITGPNDVLERLKADMRLYRDHDWRNQTQQRDFIRITRDRFGVRIGECLSWWSDDGSIVIWMDSLDSWGAHGGTVAHGLAVAYPEASITAIVTTTDEAGKESPFSVRLEFHDGEWTAALDATVCTLNLVFEPSGLTIANGTYDSFTDIAAKWDNTAYNYWKHKWESRGELLEEVTGENVWFARISDVIPTPPFYEDTFSSYFDNDFWQDDDVDEPLP